MEWTTSAARTLSPRRITIAVVSVAATASLGYILYRNYYEDPVLSGIDPSRRLHRSNAIRRPRRSLRERAPSEATSTSAESDGDENDANALAALGDGDTVADDENAVEDDWWNDPASAVQPRAGQNIVSLLFRVSEDNARRNAYVHRGCACNACGIVPIRGIRYRCANCADFDLCETCESQGHHINTHIFYKVKVPAPPFGPRQSQPVWYTGDPENCIRKLPKVVMAKLSKETGFERPELEAFWEQWTFMANTEWRDDPDELYLAMDRRTFERCLVPSAGYRHAAPNLIHDRMFAFYDTNNDDLIGFSEFLHGLSYRKRKDKLKKIFEGFDMDGDGYVTRKDFLRIFRAYYVLYKQMHKDILEGLDDQVLGSTEVHQLVSGRQPLSGFFGREGPVPPARGSRPLEGKIARDGDMTVEAGNDERVVSDDKPDTADRNAILTSLFHPERGYNGHLRQDYVGNDNMERPSSPSEDSYMMAYAELQEGANSPRYWNAILNPPAGIEDLPSLLAGEPRPGDDLFVGDDDNANDNQDQGPQAETHITADGGNTSGPAFGDDRHDENTIPPLEPATGSSWRPFNNGADSTAATREAREAREALAEHSRKVARSKRDRAIVREKLLDRWRRRQFYLDAEEGAAPPEGWDPQSDDPLGYRDPNWETSKTAQQAQPTSRSRASSKVRFAEDPDDFDTRSNPSTSSRSVPERWGGIDIPDAERDAGKEILYQVTQQAYNELLDILFAKKESEALMAAKTKPQRDRYKDLINGLPYDSLVGPFHLEEMDETRDKTLGELLAESGYAVDPSLEKKEREVNDDVLAEVDDMINAQEEAPATSTIEAQQPASTETPDTYRDPTLPQFRPNTAADTLSTATTVYEPITDGTHQPSRDKGKAPALDEPVPQAKSTTPHKEAAQGLRHEQKGEERPTPVVIDRKSLELWKRMQMAEDEAKARGGWGMLSFAEFEKIYKAEEPRDNRLDYLGSWIDFCIP